MTRIILIGVSGAGKRDVAAEIARQSELELHDFDAAFEQIVGEDPSAFMVRHGEAAYEEQSRGVATALLGADGVITLAPGVTRDEQIRHRLGELKAKGALIVELFADVSTLMRRTGLNAPRTVALGPTRKMLTDMVVAYRNDFEGLADLVIDTSLSKPEHTAGRILAFRK